MDSCYLIASLYKPMFLLAPRLFRSGSKVQPLTVRTGFQRGRGFCMALCDKSSYFYSNSLYFVPHCLYLVWHITFQRKVVRKKVKLKVLTEKAKKKKIVNPYSKSVNQPPQSNKT